MRQNILNNKWFIAFTENGEGIEYAGQILGEAADGWFFVAVVNSGLSVVSRQVLPIADLKSSRFYNSETEMVTVRRQFDKPLLRRTNES